MQILHFPQGSTLPDLHQGRFARYQPGGSQSRHHIRRLVESQPRHAVHLQSVQIRSSEDGVYLSICSAGEFRIFSEIEERIWKNGVVEIFDVIKQNESQLPNIDK